MENKQNFYDLTFEELKTFLVEKADVDKGKEKMRAQQLFFAGYKKGLKNFNDLTTVTNELRKLDYLKNLSMDLKNSFCFEFL